MEQIGHTLGLDNMSGVSSLLTEIWKIFVLMSFLTSNFLLTIRFKIMNSRLLEAIILH